MGTPLANLRGVTLVTIFLTGLRHAPGEWYCGGMWVMEVDSREEATELRENDPFYKLGLRKDYRLYVWAKRPAIRASSYNIGWITRPETPDSDCRDERCPITARYSLSIVSCLRFWRSTMPMPQSCHGSI